MTAFQPTAFQSDAFQILGGSTAIVVVSDGSEWLGIRAVPRAIYADAPGRTVTPTGTRTQAVYFDERLIYL